MYTLFITRGYPTSKFKTNGIFEFDQAKALVDLGCKVVYIAIDLRSIRRWRKWGIERQNIEGVEIYAINIPLGRISKGILWKFRFLGLKMLYKKIIRKQGKPDIVHAHFTDLAFAASKLKDMIRVPLVITEHSSKINKDKIDEKLYKIAKIAYSKANTIISVSPSLVKMIKNNFHEESIYVPNIVDLTIFKHCKKIEHDNFSFVSTGNLINSKRMDLTIEAFYEAFDGNPQVTLNIFGQGPNHNQLQDMISKYGLNAQIKLMGFCSRQQIAEQLLKTDCFVLASQSETFGVAYIEALAMGVPVIATKCGGPEAFINENNGLLIDVDSKRQLINSMIFMYENPCKYDAKRIIEETRYQFSPEMVGNKIISVYKKVLNNL
ncbi:MAG: glycosyltransferase [Candidatus Izemoplasmataceae bacterium]